MSKEYCLKKVASTDAPTKGSPVSTQMTQSLIVTPFVGDEVGDTIGTLVAVGFELGWLDGPVEIVGLSDGNNDGLPDTLGNSDGMAVFMTDGTVDGERDSDGCIEGERVGHISVSTFNW